MRSRILESRSGSLGNDYNTTQAQRRALPTVSERPSAQLNDSAAGASAPEAKADPASIDAVGCSLIGLENNFGWIVEGYDKETSHPPML
jgi:hypothetical protein